MIKGCERSLVIVSDCAERLTDSVETRNADSVGVLYSSDTAITGGEELLGRFGGRGVGWVIGFRSLATGVTRWRRK